ncbi:hypothetical protein KEU06_07905 [Pseudaminobacter sp. 19-2017]|uniref:Uncharacterized protein n=1 Tax=Pseudaminobacter soli (ex Zhang et al. 2022) TaxID=2831468 RepID=A0A942E031_9HYPH|nr:hypothetical protein [Pseudaminobacter soli]MBS3648551.1 hypothetical protein [Pseudaminobacter soli]
MRTNFDYHPCDHLKACHVLWAVVVNGWSQTRAAIAFNLNVGTVNHIIHGRRFVSAVPLPPPGDDI